MENGEWVKATVDLSTVWVVGEFFGAQMSGFDVAPALGLIDHVQDGEVNVPYPDRTVVVAGGGAFTATVKSGSLPDGMTFGELTGVLSGTPTTAGVFTFTVEAADTTGALVSQLYTVTITAGAVPPTFTVSTSASPANAGSTSGDGNYASGASVTVTAMPNAHYAFVNWTEGAAVVSASASYQFTIEADRSLVANFTPVNQSPVADNQSVTTDEDADLPITLTATDGEGDGLTYSVLAGPAHGTLSGIAPNLTYHPAPNYNGPDSFTFQANDAQADSAVATVSLIVTPTNDQPIAKAGADQAVFVRTRVALDGRGSSDVDGDPLACNWTLITRPAHSKATLNGATWANPVFKADKPGIYVVRLVVNDGTVNSEPDEVTITVTNK